jgi:hypothetical protein
MQSENVLQRKEGRKEGRKKGRMLNASLVD